MQTHQNVIIDNFASIGLDWHSQLGEAKKISQLDTNSIGLPDKLPEDEKTCTEVFMRAFADGCSLNEDLSLAILK